MRSNVELDPIFEDGKAISGLMVWGIVSYEPENTHCLIIDSTRLRVYFGGKPKILHGQAGFEK